MAISIMSQVWALQGITPAQKFVLLAIADCANDEGIAYPSIRKVGMKCSIAPRNVRMHIKALIAAGLLVAEQQLRANGSQTVNFYHLHLVTPPDDIVTPPLTISSPLEPSLEPEPSLADRLTNNAHEADESLTAKRIRDCVVQKRSFLSQRFPEADIDLETEELVAKYRSQQLGADPWLAVLRWFRNLKDRPARAAPGSGVTMAEALEMFPLKSFGGKRGSAKD